MLSFHDSPADIVPDQWPLFDHLALAPPPNLPSPASLAAMPIPPSRTSPRNKNPDHIPRPRNAFMLFRSAFAAAQKITTTIEHDNRHITRIIAHCWNRLSDADKQIWRDKAAAEKAQHAERYPHYRFKPVGRAKKPKKRKVHRNGAEDVERCETLANLVMAGKYGRELEHALNKIQAERASTQWPPVDAELDAGNTCGSLFDPLALDPDAEIVPPFQSPLLPPSAASDYYTSEQHLIPQPTTLSHMASQTFCAPTCTEAVPLLDDLQSLFCQYQPDFHNHFSSQGSIPPTQYQTETEPVRDFSLYPWNPSPSDDFSYYHH